jgi:hypothetical protein
LRHGVVGLRVYRWIDPPATALPGRGRLRDLSVAVVV